MAQEKRSKAKKGWLAVQVGLDQEGDECRRFMIPMSFLQHPLFTALLDRAQEVYGYHSPGPLRLPCSVDEFLHLRWLIERESPAQLHRAHQPSFSLRSC